MFFPQRTYLVVILTGIYSQHMNTIASEAIAKTIYVEKETYVCKTPQRQTVLADVNVYAGIISNFQNQTAISQKLDVVTCLKVVNATDVKCTSQTPPDDFLPEMTCSVMTPLRRPVLMNSVAGTGNMTHLDKTIEADSTVFSCRDSNDTRLIKNVITFTEIYEDLEKMVSKKGVESVVCVKDIVNVNVLGCYFQKVM
jgi:hypothetical protein